MSPEDSEAYAAAVGERWERYRPRFERFARGERVSWNWAAFFATFGWLRYRKLYVASWLYFFVSTPVLLVVLLIERQGDSCERALDPGTGAAIAAAIAGIIALGWIVPPLFADRLYYDQLRASLRKEGGVATAAPWSSLALQAFLLMIAVAAVSSYGSYRYRSMVSDGLNMAGAAKTASQEYQERHGRMPSRIEELVTEPLGRLAALSLEPDGTVRASFGAQASKLAGRSVSFTPLRQEGRIVAWVCRSDLPDRCVPQACRRAS